MELALVQLDDAGAPLEIPVSVPSGDTPESQRLAEKQSDVVVRVIVPHERAHHVAHLQGRGEESRVDVRRGDTLLLPA